jgi:hypothetical protein
MFKHEKISAAADDGDPLHVQGTEWNEHHVIGNLAMWVPRGGSTTLDTIGTTPPTVSGTATARSPGTSSLVDGIKRIGYVSTGIATSVTGVRNTTAQYWRGNAANCGGFHCLFRWAISDAPTVATGRIFVGLQAATGAPTDADPSGLSNLIGVGTNANDTVFQLYAAGAVAQARVSLGANFPSNTSTDVYELRLFCAPNAATITYRLRRLNTSDVASGTISAAAALPASTTFLTQQMWRSNGVTATAVGIDLVGMFAETDF